MNKPTVKSIFSDVTWEWINRCFNILVDGIDQNKSEVPPLPFILSREFIAKYESILRQIVIPELASRCNGLIRRAEEQSEDQIKPFLVDYFDDRQGRTVMRESWQKSWKAAMMKQEIPPKPKPKGLSITSFLKTKSKPSGGKKQLTEQEWKDAVIGIKKINKTNQENWSLLCEQTQKYTPPKETDNKMLMSVFLWNEKALADQIKAIHQIVHQGENAGVTFGRYQNNKDVDLTLLAASYQYPELYLTGDTMLKNLLKGQNGDNFPLIARFLPDYINS